MTEVEETQELEEFREEDPSEFDEDGAPYDEDPEEDPGPYYDDCRDDPRRLKLKMKPVKPKKACGASGTAKKDEGDGADGGNGTGGAGYDVNKVPRTAKMALRRKTGLDLLKKQIPIPDGAIPRTALPSWYELSMNERIPMVPAPKNYIYYSRGKLGTALLRCHPFFSTYDHRNLERVVIAPYSALHDPHAREYLSKPAKKAFLIEQGLINEDNEVLCSLRDFNAFRNYLRTQFNNEVHRAVSSGDQTWKSDKTQFQRILMAESAEEGKQAVRNNRRLRAIQLQSELRSGKLKKMDSKQRQNDLRMVEWSEGKRKENLCKIIAGYEKSRRIADRLYYVRMSRKEAQRKLLKATTLKDIDALERRQSDKKLMERSLERFKIEWIDSKLEYSKQRAIEDAQLEEAMRKDVKNKSRKRQRRAEYQRTQIPIIIEKKKEEGQRIWEIVRKFAMRWLEKVRKRLNAPKDVQHESVWIGKSKGVLDDTLKYLKEVSGYEKMDDFVLNIIKLKKQIQHQIEVEEAQEAAEAEAAAKAAAGPTSGGASPRSSGGLSPRGSKDKSAKESVAQSEVNLEVSEVNVGGADVEEEEDD